MTQTTPTRLRTLALMLTVSEEQLGFVLTDLEVRGIHTVDYRIVEHAAPPKLLQHKPAKKAKAKAIKAVKKGKRSKEPLTPAVMQHFKDAGANPVPVKELHKIAKKQGKSNAAVSYVLKSLMSTQAIFQTERGKYQIAAEGSHGNH